MLSISNPELQNEMTRSLFIESSQGVKFLTLKLMLRKMVLGIETKV